jgi:hypothetical protein
MGYYKDGVRTHTADGVRIGGKVKVAHDSGAGGSAEELARQEAGWVHYSVGSGEPGFLGLKVDVPEGRAAIAINKVTGKMRVATNNMNKPDAQILNLWGGKVKAKLGAK